MQQLIGILTIKYNKYIGNVARDQDGRLTSESSHIVKDKRP